MSSSLTIPTIRGSVKASMLVRHGVRVEALLARQGSTAEGSPHASPTVVLYLLSSTEPIKAPLRGVAQFGSAPALGAGGRRFESCRPDQ